MVNNVKKKLIIVVLCCLIIKVSFSGCLDNEPFESSSNIILIDYSIMPYMSGKSSASQDSELTEGFDYVEGIDGFWVNGKIKNVEETPLKKIKVIGNFYNEDLCIGSVSDVMENMSVGEIRNFSLNFCPIDDYLFVVDNVTFDFKILKFDRS